MRWVIGDIHGMLRPLDALVRAVERADPQRQLLFVGDYVNRGPDSRGVIDLLINLPQAHFVRGNHDDVFDHVLSAQSYCGEAGPDYRMTAFHWFMQHGLDKTFLSYGVPEEDLERALRQPTPAHLEQVVSAVPEAHRAFVRNLPVVLESDELFVAHAKWDAYASDEKPPVQQRLAQSQPTRYALLWGRYRLDEVQADKPWRRTGYFGHTPVDSYMEFGSDELLPVTGPKIVLIDTAAALVSHGRLTAVCHETGSFLQVDSEGRVVG
ncbi:MAG TPA: metallophosphoesterase [Tepidisphaeraceae bacterium]|nr:metallophosphoesterase [Tepidisphaeraceae bacterium]